MTDLERAPIAAPINPHMSSSTTPKSMINSLK